MKHHFVSPGDGRTSSSPPIIRLRTDSRRNFSVMICKNRNVSDDCKTHPGSQLNHRLDSNWPDFTGMCEWKLQLSILGFVETIPPHICSCNCSISDVCIWFSLRSLLTAPNPSSHSSNLKLWPVPTKLWVSGSVSDGQYWLLISLSSCLWLCSWLLGSREALTPPTDKRLRVSHTEPQILWSSFPDWH